MSKYTINEDRITDNKELYLGFVANELAEANRLKRIELNLKLYEGEIRTTSANMKKFDKDLEDKA